MSEVEVAYALAVESVRKAQVKSLIAEPVSTAVTSLGRAVLAVDAREVRHLLVPIAPDESVLVHHGTALRLTERVIPGRSQVSGRFADLHCVDPSLTDLFEKLVSSTLAEIQLKPEASGQSALHRALDRWRALLSSTQPAHQTVQGLFGELWVLRILAERDPLGGFNAWTGWDSTRHDFMSAVGALEVKTTRVTGPVTISSMFQLDPSGLPGLRLVQVEAEARPEGISLSDLFEMLVEQGVSATALRSRMLGVLRTDEVPVEPRYVVSGLNHWVVNDSFPSLRVADLPERADGRVTRLTYSLRVDDLPGGSKDEGLLRAEIFGAPA